jgi:hypothetical protein
VNVVKKPKPRDPRKPRKPSSYRVDFETTAHLHHQSENDGITDVRGKIIHEDGNQNETPVGNLHGYCVRSERLAETGGDLFDICDAHYPQLCDVASLVSNSNKRAWRDELDLEKPFDLIIPWTVTLLPEHRGKGVGLLALWRFIDYFGGGATIAVLKPFPLNHQEHESDDDYEKMQYGQFAKVSLKDGQAKLAAHWGKLGFKRIPDSDFFYFDMRCARPSLEDLIKKERR